MFILPIHIDSTNEIGYNDGQIHLMQSIENVYSYNLYSMGIDPNFMAVISSAYYDFNSAIK